MKNIILTIMVAFSITNLNAQEKEKIVVQEGAKWPQSTKKGVVYKVPDTESQKFEGTWVYKNENVIFKIKIKSEEVFSKSTGNYVSILKGIYCYSNSEVNCNINYDTDNKHLIYEGEWNDQFGQKINFRFFDDDYEKYGKLTFELLSNGQANWTLKERERGKLRFDGTKSNDGFSVPTNVILTKEE